MKHALLDAVAGLSRRQVLGFAGAAVLSACGGGGASGASAGRITVAAGSASGTGPVEQAIGQIGSMAFDPATGGLVVDTGKAILRYPVRDGSVNLEAGVAIPYMLSDSNQRLVLNDTVPVALDPSGNVYCAEWRLEGVSYASGPHYDSGNVFQVSPTGSVVSSVSDRAGTLVLPDGMALLPDGSLAFYDGLSGYLMRWQVGKGVTPLVQLVPAIPGYNARNSRYQIDLLPAPSGVYVVQLCNRVGQNGVSEDYFKVLLWDSVGLNHIANIAAPAGERVFNKQYAAKRGQVVLRFDRSVVTQQNGGLPWMMLLQPDGQVRQVDLFTLEGRNLPEVSKPGWWLSMAFAPDGALWMVRKFGASGGALLRIELPS
ncbi:SMP-30/gluconolactonase/LRE family protein [Hydrogenophaga soli]